MIPDFILNNDVALPAVGFGTYLIDDGDTEAVVGNALAAGYRHIDTAEAYRNERGVGKAINSFLAADSRSRSDVFVTTKLWPGNAAWGMQVKDAGDTERSLNDSLERLGLDYVDLYLIHAPFATEHRLDQWRTLVRLRDEGKIRAIGVSNYNRAHIEEIIAAGLPLPQVNQIELHPWSQKPQLINYLQSQHIQPIAYSSLVPLSSWRAEDGQRSGKTQGSAQEEDVSASTIGAIATKHGVAEAQVLLRWGIQRGFAIIPKSTNPDRMRSNIQIAFFELDERDMDQLDALERGDGVAWESGDPTRAD